MIACMKVTRNLTSPMEHLHSVTPSPGSFRFIKCDDSIQCYTATISSCFPAPFRTNLFAGSNVNRKFRSTTTCSGAVQYWNSTRIKTKQTQERIDYSDRPRFNNRHKEQNGSTTGRNKTKMKLFFIDVYVVCDD